MDCKAKVFGFAWSRRYCLNIYSLMKVSSNRSKLGTEEFYRFFCHKLNYILLTYSVKHIILSHLDEIIKWKTCTEYCTEEKSSAVSTIEKEWNLKIVMSGI